MIQTRSCTELLPPTYVSCVSFHCSGQLCEIPPHGSLQPSACEKAECQNGASCVELGSRILCQCLPGFGGPKCEKLLSVNFVDRDTYLQFTDLQNWPSANITLQVRCSNQSSAATIPKAESCLVICSVCNSFSASSCWFSHSLQVSTAEDNGILLYNGDTDHMAVELYQGHVRVSYDPGTYPSSAIYR